MRICYRLYRRSTLSSPSLAKNFLDENLLVRSSGPVCAFRLHLPCSLTACGGGGDSGSPTGLTDIQRAQAALITAESTTNACMPIRPFYWEIGDANFAKTSGSVGGTTYIAGTAMPIASATKWLYASYVAELRAGVMTAPDIKFLNFQSGYTNFGLCLPGQTVDACLALGTNGTYTAVTDGKFLYDGGHMQKHASLNGLGNMDNAALATELRSRLGNDVALTFNQPQLAGGADTSAADYALVLRKLLTGTLRMGALLGTQPVCTNPLTCPQALGTPVPTTESWHYSLGHWVEDDPRGGRRRLQQPPGGPFGFYPWIDATKTYYGVLARQGAAGTGVDSVNCGRLIRKAWVTGVAL
ncbi:MAG: hypothetical protein IPI20_17235 [Rhodoferax sp.]|nr:hypothetical protein [Rhodoferax sp.]